MANLARAASGIPGALLTGTGAEKLVYEEKIDKLLGQAGEGDSGKENAPIQQNEFYWDQIVLVLVSAMLGLTFLEISIEFFRGSKVQCYFDIDNFTESKGDYINSYCYDSLPNTQYYVVFILGSALLVVAPHYFWSAYFAAQFKFFFDLIKRLDRLRDTNTGEYNSRNFERVKTLEERFNNSDLIFFCYKLKLVFQLAACAIVLVINIVYFKNEFDPTFDCPKDCALDRKGNQSTPNCTDLRWPLNQQFKCVYSAFKLLDFLHKTMYSLLGLVIIVLFIGLIWSCVGRHAVELGAVKVAEFCFNSCLHAEAFSFTSSRKILHPIYCYRKLESLSSCRERYWTGSKLGLSLYPRIENDLDFLLKRLFKADSGHGQVFKDIQIERHLRTLVVDDHKRLYLFNQIHGNQLQENMLSSRDMSRSDIEACLNPLANPTASNGDIKQYFFNSGFSAQGNNPDKKIYDLAETKYGARWTDQSSIRDVIFGFFQFAPNNKAAMAVSFCTISSSYSLILARAFHDVATVHFNPFYKNPKQIYQVEKFHPNYQTITFRDDIFGPTTKATNLDQPIRDFCSDNENIDLILIGPMTGVSMSDTTNLLIEKLHSKHYFTRNAVLLAIRPLWIGTHNRVMDYWQFRPSQDYFRDISDAVEDKLKDAAVTIWNVKTPFSAKHDEQDNLKGLLVRCDDVECIFEFRLFQYCSVTQSSTEPQSTNESVYSASSNSSLPLYPWSNLTN